MKKHMEKMEKVQRAATRRVPSLRDLSCEEIHKKLQLPTLAERRERGDMIMMLYKCVEGKEKIDVNENVILSQSSLRGHIKKLYKKRLKRDVKMGYQNKLCVSKIFIVLKKSMTKLCKKTEQNELESILHVKIQLCKNN